MVDHISRLLLQCPPPLEPVSEELVPIEQVFQVRFLA